MVELARLLILLVLLVIATSLEGVIGDRGAFTAQQE